MYVVPSRWCRSSFFQSLLLALTSGAGRLWHQLRQDGYHAATTELSIHAASRDHLVANHKPTACPARL